MSLPSTEGCTNKISGKKTLKALVFLSQLAFHYLAVSTTMISPLGSASTALYASPGVVRYAQGLSLRNFLVSFVISAAIFAIEVCVFVLLKDRLKQI